MEPRQGRENHGFVSREAVAGFVLGASRHTVTALGGIDAMGLRAALDAVEPEPFGQRALAARIAPASTTEAIVEQAIAVLAETARLVWPIWFTDVSFPARDDALGRLAAVVTARGAAREIAGASPSWLEAAARLALADRPPASAERCRRSRSRNSRSRSADSVSYSWPTSRPPAGTATPPPRCTRWNGSRST